MNIQEKLNRIKEEAQKLGINLKIYPKNFDPQRLDALWYGGDIASFQYNNHTVIISAVGNVEASYFEDGKLLYNVHKEPCLSPELAKHLTDKELHDDSITRYTYVDEKIASQQNKVLFIEANNWLEFNVINNKTNLYWDLIFSNIIEDDANVLNTLEDLQYYIDFIEENKENCD